MSMEQMLAKWLNMRIEVSRIGPYSDSGVLVGVGAGCIEVDVEEVGERVRRHVFNLSQVVCVAPKV